MRYLFILLLAGCQSIPDVIEVKIPVPVSCVVKVDKPEFITDKDLLGMQSGNFVTALHIDRLKRINYISELESVITGCDFK